MTVPVEKLLKPRTADGRSPQSAPPKKVIFIPVPSFSVPAIIRWAFLLFVFTLPFEAMNYYLKSSPVTLTKISGLLFFACCLLYPKRCFAHPPHALWWFLGYLTTVTLHGLIIPGELVGGIFSRFITLIQLAVLFWVASCLLQEEKLARSVLLTFSMAAVLLSLGTIFHAPGFEVTQRGGRMTALDANPNAVAHLTASATVILIGLLLDKTVRPLWSKVSLAALTLPLILFTVQTGSRAGMGGLIIGVSLYLLPYSGAKQKMVRMIWAALVIVGVVYMIISNPDSSSRWELAYEGNTAGRGEMFAAAIQMISERPIFGWHDTQYELGKRMHTVGAKQDAHNLYLHLLAEGGIVGALPFLVALWLCTRAAWKARKGPLGMLPLALLVSLLAHSMVHTGLLEKTNWLILSSAAAAPSFMRRERRGRLGLSLGGKSFPAQVSELSDVHKRTNSLRITQA